MPHYAHQIYRILALLHTFINTNIASTGHNFSTLQIRKAGCSILKIKLRFHICGLWHCSIWFVCFHINEYQCIFRIQLSDSHESLYGRIGHLNFMTQEGKENSSGGAGYPKTHGFCNDAYTTYMAFKIPYKQHTIVAKMENRVNEWGLPYVRMQHMIYPAAWKWGKWKHSMKKFM